MVGLDIFSDIFGFCEDAVRFAAFGILLHFAECGTVYFDECEFFVARNGEADTAYAGVKVEDFGGGDMLFDFSQNHFVDWQIDLEESVRRVAVFVAKKCIGEIIHDWMRLAIDEEVAASIPCLVAA